MLAFRAYASSQHYVASLVIHAESETDAILMLEQYTEVELLGRARIDLLMAAHDLPDDQLPDPEDFVYVPFYALDSIAVVPGRETGVALDTVDEIVTEPSTFPDED